MMNTKSSVRFGVLLAASLAAARMAAACGGDDPVAGPPDAGTITPVADAAPDPGPADTGAPDTGTVDSGKDDGGDAGPPSAGTFVSFVHNASDGPDFTPCFLSAAGTPLNPSAAGQGTSARYSAKPIVTTAAAAESWASGPVRLVQIPKASAHACDASITAAIGIDGVELLETFPVGTFQREKSYVLMWLGCEDPDFAWRPWCFPDWDGANGGGAAAPTRRFQVIEVDGVPVGPGAFGYQLIHAGHRIQKLFTDEIGAPLSLELYVNGAAYYTTRTRTPYAAYAGTGATQAVPPVAVRGNLEVIDPLKTGLASLFVEDTDGGAPYEAWTIPTMNEIEVTTTGNSTFTYFQEGKNYVFVLLTPSDNHREARLVAVPTRW